MFDSLSDRFDGIFKRLRGRGHLTEKDIDEVAREIRLALLEADVNVRVVKSFIARVKERANGAEVAKSLSPAQQVIKIVHEELVEALGGATGKLTISSQPPTVVMLVGSPGIGKDDRRRPSSRASSSATASGCCSSVPTCSARPRSSSSACSGKRDRRAGVLGGRPTPSPSRAAASRRRRGSGATS